MGGVKERGVSCAGRANRVVLDLIECVTNKIIVPKPNGILIEAVFEVVLGFQEAGIPSALCVWRQKNRLFCRWVGENIGTDGLKDYFFRIKVFGTAFCTNGSGASSGDGSWRERSLWEAGDRFP